MIIMSIMMIFSKPTYDNPPQGAPTDSYQLAGRKATLPLSPSLFLSLALSLSLSPCLSISFSFSLSLSLSPSLPSQVQLS